MTKKIGNAVARNRIKRAVREAFRDRACNLARGASMVVIARDGSAALSACETAAELGPAMASIQCGATGTSSSPARSAGRR